MQVVEVVWEDAYNDEGAGWTDIESVKTLKPTIIKTVGFLVHESPEAIILASDMDEANEEVHTPLYIPRGMVRLMKKLS